MQTRSLQHYRMAEITGSAHVTAGNHFDEKVQAIKEQAKAPTSVVAPATIASLVEIAESAPKRGCFVEVGVYKGGTAFHLARVAREQGRRIYLFDTFEGIPYTDKEMGDRHEVGDFNDVKMADVVAAIPDAIVVKGVFPQSMIPLPLIAFVHIDADQYESIFLAVRALEPHMMKGGIMVFDDWGALEGATNAIKDLFDGDRIEITSAGKAMVRYQ